MYDIESAFPIQPISLQYDWSEGGSWLMGQIQVDINTFLIGCISINTSCLTLEPLIVETKFVSWS